MNKKLTVIGIVALAVILIGSIFLAKAGGQSAKYNIENWTGNLVEGITGNGTGNDEGSLGAIQFQTGRVTYDKLATNTLQEAIVTVSSVSFAELATTSVELLPVPPGGPGFINQIVDIVGYRKFSSESFNNNSAGAPTIGYSDLKKIAITASLSKGLFSGGADSTSASPSYIVVNPAIAYSAASNSAVVLRRVGATEPTNLDGDTSFIFKILYRIIPLP